MAGLFSDRHAAGRALADALHEYAGRSDVVVLALPRGGVPVGYEVARALGADFDVLVVRKLGLPFHRELAMGAIVSGGAIRSEEHTSELHSLMRISYAVFCLKKKKRKQLTIMYN